MLEIFISSVLKEKSYTFYVSEKKELIPLLKSKNLLPDEDTKVKIVPIPSESAFRKSEEKNEFLIANGCEIYWHGVSSKISKSIHFIKKAKQEKS